MAMSNQDIMTAIKEMPVLQLADLVKQLQEEFGVSAAPAVAAPGAGVAPGAAPAAVEEEKTAFDVILTAAGDKKIQVIKAVREVVSGLGLKEAKALVDSAPKPIKEGVTREEAAALKAKLEEQGATVSIQ